MVHNPNCDGDHCLHAAGRVRVLPTGADSNAILCRPCFDHEMRWRIERNKELETSCQYDLPKWLSLRTVDEHEAGLDEFLDGSNFK